MARVPTSRMPRLEYGRGYRPWAVAWIFCACMCDRLFCVMYVCMICVFVWICVYNCIYIYTHIYIYIYNILSHINTCIFMCVHVQLHTLQIIDMYRTMHKKHKMFANACPLSDSHVTTAPVIWDIVFGLGSGETQVARLKVDDMITKSFLEYVYYTHTYIYIYVQKNIYSYIIYTLMHIHWCVYIYIQLFVYTYYTCIYIYTWNTQKLFYFSFLPHIL